MFEKWWKTNENLVPLDKETARQVYKSVLLDVVFWLQPQRNDVSATGMEFASALCDEVDDC